MSAKIVLTIGKRKLSLSPKEARQLLRDLESALKPVGFSEEILRKIQEVKDSIPPALPYPIYRERERERRTPWLDDHTIICRTETGTDKVRLYDGTTVSYTFGQIAVPGEHFLMAQRGDGAGAVGTVPGSEIQGVGED